MNHLHTENKNLTIYRYTKFNGVELLPNHQFITEYLSAIEITLGRALRTHSRVLMLRFDLHYLAVYSCPDYPSRGDVISRFFASLKAKYEADQQRKSREGKRARQECAHFVWCKEQKDALTPHYHVALFLSLDAYNTLGDKNYFNSNAGRITGAWASALSIEFRDAYNLVHIPTSKPAYYLNVNHKGFEQEYNDAFKRLSYLAKVETKAYCGGRSFGCSRN